MHCGAIRESRCGWVIHWKRSWAKELGLYFMSGGEPLKRFQHRADMVSVMFQIHHSGDLKGVGWVWWVCPGAPPFSWTAFLHCSAEWLESYTLHNWASTEARVLEMIRFYQSEIHAWDLEHGTEAEANLYRLCQLAHLWRCWGFLWWFHDRDCS